MFETKAVLVSISLVLLVAASFCLYQAHTEDKVGHHSEVKSQGPCENEYKKFCLKGSECFYLGDEDFVGSKCTWLYGRKGCEVHMGRLRASLKFKKTERLSIQSLTGRTNFNSNSDTL